MIDISYHDVMMDGNREGKYDIRRKAVSVVKVTGTFTGSIGGKIIHEQTGSKQMGK